MAQKISLLATTCVLELSPDMNWLADDRSKKKHQGDEMHSLW
jgi:hypothetical protein